ncbi:hypothetical protein NHP200010_09770 [Helicobacter bizzozeronii]|uniref:hypothetical protein n=1 Tax=Helicobacter bizzozeronii TaxID=56877 RepID=UPI00244D8CBB|nr:hypothetical protein [Helicobacter bizzozeronii]GMB93263.1 hypothetical protein NHP200010_09770 [Helicobacter bizzozeronii]
MAYFIQYDTLIECEGHKRGEEFSSSDRALIDELLSIGTIAERQPEESPTQEGKEGEAIDLPPVE